MAPFKLIQVSTAKRLYSYLPFYLKKAEIRGPVTVFLGKIGFLLGCTMGRLRVSWVVDSQEIWFGNVKRLLQNCRLALLRKEKIVC